MKSIISSVEKTKNLIVVDASHEISSFGKEIIANVAMANMVRLANKPQLISLPDVPEPTSYGVIGQYRVSAQKIARAAFEALAIPVPNNFVDFLTPQREDIPDSLFTGPF
jgi:pyruvate dehydrogenase E1 component beta subunit